MLADISPPISKKDIICKLEGKNKNTSISYGPFYTLAK